MGQNPYSATAGFSSLNLGPQFHYASRLKRLGAKLIDSFFLCVCIALALGLSYGLQLGIPVMYTLSFGVYTAVQLFLLYKSAQTIGKKLLNIKVAHEDGSDASFGQIIGRGVIGVILNFVPLLGLIDVLLIFRESNQCAHDQVAKTLVIEA